MGISSVVSLTLHASVHATTDCVPSMHMSGCVHMMCGSCLMQQQFCAHFRWLVLVASELHVLDVLKQRNMIPGLGYLAEDEDDAHQPDAMVSNTKPP